MDCSLFGQLSSCEPTFAFTWADRLERANRVTTQKEVKFYHSDLDFESFFSSASGRTTNLNNHNASTVAWIGASQYTNICSLVIWSPRA